MNSQIKFADLHCHPHMRSYNWLHNHRKPEEKSKYNSLWIILSKLKAQKEGKRAAAYSQCNMVKVLNGNLKLGFLSLYPLEKGWGTGRKDLSVVFAKNIKKYLWENKLNEIVSAWLNKLLQFIGNDKKGELALRDVTQSIYMKVPLHRINFVQSGQYNYFKELHNEKKFLDKRNDKHSRTKFCIPFLKRIFTNKKKIIAESEFEVEGTYILAKNGNHVKQAIAEDKTAFVLTIKGANVFNTQDDFVSIKENIMKVKGWNEPVFFITFTHHFYNHLTWHSQNIPSYGYFLLDQEEGMKSGFTLFAMLRKDIPKL